uniref:Uncharacterized protein n=1 Tax=Panagrolaimus superbus TaxID=310955 RepID=A0A914Z826_9BILA
MSGIFASSDPGSVELYTLDDLKQMNLLDKTAVEYLLSNPMPDDDLLLVLDFVTQQTFHQKEQINDALRTFGGTRISPHVIQYRTWDDLLDARRRMFESHPQWFYTTNAQIALLHNCQNTTTIKSTLILALSEATDKFKLSKFKFFSVFVNDS